MASPLRRAKAALSRRIFADLELERPSADQALVFLDPVIAKLPRGVDLVRVLLDERYETDPIGLSGDDESLVLPRLIYHRLHPQLADAVSTDKVSLSDKNRRRIEASATSLAVRRLALEGLLVGVASTLSSVDVEFLVLKGIATGRLDYPDAVRRQTTDVDILVRPGQFQRSIVALADSGFNRRHPLGLLDKGQAWESSAGVVDVHTRPHAAGHFLSEHWWTTSETLAIAGREFRALSRAGRMAHSAGHYSVAYPNHRILSSLLDLLVITRLASDAERAEAERFLTEIGVSDITARITNRAAALVGDSSVILGRVGRRPLDRMLRNAYDRPDLDLMAMKLAKTFGMPWKEKIPAIRNFVAPSEEFLALGGYTSRTDRLGSVLRRRRNPMRDGKGKTGDGLP